MNILIVDDEYYIVKGIVKHINWDKIGINTILTAYSMQQAQNIFQKEKIDILLSDIEMPKGTGLDLVEWAASCGYYPVSLLLTGHKRFDYAQKALRMQCINYILKPVENHVLEAHLQEAVGMVQHNTKQSDANKIVQYWNSEKDNFQESFWRKLLTFPTPLSDKQIKESLERIDAQLDMTASSFYMPLINISFPQAALEQKCEIPLDIIQSMIFEKLCNKKGIPLIKISSNTLVALCPAEPYADFAEFYNTCNSLLPDLTTSTGLRYVMYLDNRVTVKQARKSYQLLYQFKDSIMLNDSIVLPISTLTDDSFIPNFAAPFDIPLDIWLEWLLQLQSQKIIDDIHNKYLNYDAAYYSVITTKTIYLGIMQTIFSALENKRISPTEIFPKLLPHTGIMQETLAIDTFIHWISSILKNTEELLTAENNSDSIVYSVKKYVHEYIGSSALNRTFLAAKIHLNPDYMSYLFHKESGQSLSTYILNERITMAKKLLITSPKSLQEIAELAGFSNSSYFHKQFKKLTGMTPHQYRTGNQSRL